MSRPKLHRYQCPYCSHPYTLPSLPVLLRGSVSSAEPQTSDGIPSHDLCTRVDPSNVCDPNTGKPLPYVRGPGIRTLPCPYTWRPWEESPHKHTVRRSIDRVTLYMRYRPAPFDDYMVRTPRGETMLIPTFAPYRTAPTHVEVWDRLATLFWHASCKYPDHSVRDER